MSKKLFVGNLAYTISSEDLQSIFEKHGDVMDAKVIEDRDTGRSKGFGFVEMSSQEEAREAIEALNEQEFNGRKLVVNEAHEKRDNGGQRRGGGGGFSNRGGRGDFNGNRRRY
ncbi:MAG: RNA recognition motif domain-containing protein [Chlamydiota bacterium]